jgi:hypothetical protein
VNELAIPGDGGCPAIGVDPDSYRAFGHDVHLLPGQRDDLVELQVQRPEIPSDQVPMCLLGEVLP